MDVSSPLTKCVLCLLFQRVPDHVCLRQGLPGMATELLLLNAVFLQRCKVVPWPCRVAKAGTTHTCWRTW